MKKILLIFLLLLSRIADAQNIPACDTLLINCCTFDSIGPNTLTLYASNGSSVLFDYPAFVLFDNNLDTIAKETVMYFGIGGGPQPHTLDIVAPLNLPFSGKLSLYSLFYTSLDCTWPITIQDTVNGVHETIKDQFSVFPNPSAGYATLAWKSSSFNNGLSCTLTDITGRVLYETELYESTTLVPLKDCSAGIYLLQVKDDKELIFTKKLMVMN